ncbi:MAG: NAD(P)/FAD-dependent oxidoreductase, partial [Bacteroidota bacterium]
MPVPPIPYCDCVSWSDLLNNYDVIIIGAGAAGLMCAIEAGKRGRSVLILERNEKIGEKIRISGGGRCNFTNLNADHANYLSQNPHFCKSALARFTTADFISLVEKHKIAYHQKKLGQLFCDGRSQQIIEMLKRECDEVGVQIQVRCEVKEVPRADTFTVSTNLGAFTSRSLVIATGGLSVPQLGATNFAFTVARQFGLKVTKLKPGLVPLTFYLKDVKFFSSLAGVSIDAVVSCDDVAFRENVLFTHRGLSGPAILQISSYWTEGEPIALNILPEIDAFYILLANHQSKKELVTLLDQHLPRRFAVEWSERIGGSRPMNQYSRRELERIAQELQDWQIIPSGTEGFGKAEVTVGGVDTDELSSKTMESKKVRGLFFVGECVDVTG